MTHQDLLEASELGDGFCLVCGSYEHHVPGPHAIECYACAAIAVLPASVILAFLLIIEPGEGA